VTIPAKVRADLRERSGGCCERCGKPFANNAHHRKNRSQGGQDTLSNLLMLCGSGTTGCHGYITEHPTDSYNNGWSVRSTADPELVPVVYRGYWVKLDDVGDFRPMEGMAHG
jgi:hypothetical protein